MSENLKITSIEELQKYGAGEIVPLPPFAENQPFVAKLKRPSMLSLIENGKIPNALISSANKLFLNGPAEVIKSDVLNEEALTNLLGLLKIICKESFVSPTYDQLCEAGIELTDDQQMFVFSYSQRGVEALRSFR